MKKDSVTVILYGKDQLEANGPWMLLRQLGFDNVKVVLLGGYDYMADEDINYYEMHEIPLYLVEEPLINYAEFIENATLNSGQVDQQKEEPKQITPVKRKKKNSS
jgi:3-mercaptopyruvate sulfurtransferase SseA